MKKTFYRIAILSALCFSASLFQACMHRDQAPTAAAVSTIEKIVCAPQVYQTLAKWESPTAWHQDSDESDGSKTLRSPTATPDVYLTLNIRRGETEAIRTSSSGSIVIRWEERKGCAPAAQVADEKSTHTAGQFSEFDFDRLMQRSLKNSTTGLILVWSPHMNYSVKGAVEALVILRKLKMELVLLLDPSADFASAEAVAKANGLPKEALRRLESSSLMNRDMLNHYPSFVVFTKGQIVGKARLGYDTPEHLQNFIRQQVRP